MKTLAFIGNFDVPWSSESHYAWTFENRLGWRVIRIQENRTSTSEVIRQCENADCLFWVHTHGWDFANADEIVQYVKERRIPSFSYHLDKYWGIPAREGAYLSHPSFHLDIFASTDGGHDADWQKAGIAHVYIPAGCVEYGSYIADNPTGEIFDIRFFGSVGYHAEYPWRPKMVAALQANYGNRFEVVSGIREEALNLKMAQTRVVVGDHIFAGCPMYASDRLFETIARGGFLVYPETPGVTDKIPGLYTYRAQDIDSLFHAIDYFLDKAHESDRIARRDAAHDWIKNNATYTHRLREILKVMNLS